MRLKSRPRPVALLGAIALDLLVGEWPNRLHPVAWFGRGLEALEARAPGRRVLDGAVALGTATALAWGLGALAARLARRAGPAGVLLEALALKPAFAIRRLATAASEVEAALRAGELARARWAVGRHLVSRPTGSLSPAEVTSAAVESVAENLADSVVGPLGAYALGGLPAAWAFRAINTADSLWGYRDAAYERFGKAAARADDVANLLPSRLAAGALVAGAAIAGEDPLHAARLARRDARRTPSPNAGWPMAAMAGALGVGLAKPGVYRLGDGPLPDSPETIRRARRVFAAGAGVACLALFVVAVWRR